MIFSSVLFLAVILHTASCQIISEATTKGLKSIFSEIGFSPSCVAKTLAFCEINSKTSETTDIKNDVNKLKEIVENQILSKIPKPRNCYDLLNNGDITSGVRTIYPFFQEKRPVLVYCDQETDGGGWTTFQHRENLTIRENFFRKWTEYKLGFGNITGEFWLGLDNIHALVRDTLMEINIELEDYEGVKRNARYDYFYITDASKNYILDVGMYSGNAGDGFKDRHIGFPFSTRDRDHDSHKTNCAEAYKGGWWYDKCHISNLNGYQYVGKHESYADGINWHPFRGYKYSLKKTSMSVRPRFNKYF